MINELNAHIVSSSPVLITVLSDSVWFFLIVNEDCFYSLQM